MTVARRNVKGDAAQPAACRRRGGHQTAMLSISLVAPILAATSRRSGRPG